MKILRAIQRLLKTLFNATLFDGTGVDSHRWESKMEIMQRLSSHHG